MNEFVITFDAVIKAKQRVRMFDDSITAQILEEMLKKGTALTTLQKGGFLVIRVGDEGDPIGIVEEIDNQCEFSNFEVEPD